MSLQIELNPENKDQKQKIRTKDIELDENVSFEDMLLSKPILDGLKQTGFFKPSPIQLKAIPLGKLGLDLIVQAKSGTGKTCVFSVISLEHILSSKTKALQVLILAPTREVAIQITDAIKSITQLVKCSAFIGGQSLKQDKIKLKTCQIAVGTPGRILHLIGENLLITSNIRLFIMDEADKLLEPEFQESINLIYSKLPDNKQMIFLSATYPSYMASYATRYMRSPTFVRLNIIDPSLRGIKQYYKITPHSSMHNKSFDFKVEALIKLLSQVQFQQAIVFTNYQIKAESLCKTLTQGGWQAIFTSGHIEQNQRNFAMSQLKQFKCRILVSTDLTSRGVDAQNVDLVVCMDLPADPETYLHRIGRAGRYGCKGIAVSFISEKDEASKFEEVIDSYCLKIKQFNEGLEDIVLERNEATEASRKDDVTIEKVILTKEQLDKSLFEYEEHKKIDKYTKSKIVESNKIEIESEKTQKLSNNGRLVTFDEIEKNFQNFQNFQNENENENLEITQKMIYKCLIEKCANLDINEVWEKRRDFSKALNLRLKNEGSKTIEKPKESIDLKTLYPWQPVEKTPRKEIKHQQEKLVTADNEPDQLLAYSMYYNFYYKHYYQKFLSDNKY